MVTGTCVPVRRQGWTAYVLVFWKKKLVLFAVPKTGTTALEAALAPQADAAILNPPGMKHCTVRKYERELARFFEQNGKRRLERVAVVRAPLDWLGSWYRYRGRAQLDGHENSTRGKSFSEFVAAWLEDSPPAFAQVGQQARFLDAIGQPAQVDHLFRYEDLGRATAFLEDRLGVALDLAARNVSPRQALDLDPGLAARVRAERADEFRVWEAAGSV